MKRRVVGASVRREIADVPLEVSSRGGRARAPRVEHEVPENNLRVPCPLPMTTCRAGARDLSRQYSIIVAG